MDSSSSNVSRSLPFHIDLNETPLSSPRETENVALIEHPEPGLVKNEPFEPDPVGGGSVTQSQRNVRFCSACELGSKQERGQKDEWKCFKCLLGNSGGGKRRDGGGGGGRGGGGGGVVLLDINASPPREPDGDGVFVDLNESAVGGRESEQSYGAKVQAVQNSSFIGHSSNAIASSFLTYKENGFNFQKPASVAIHKSQMEDTIQHRPLSDEISSSKIEPVPMFESRGLASHFTAKKSVPQSAREVYLQGLSEYISGMKGTLGDGWHVEFKYCDKRCKTYAVYVGPDGNVFESIDDVARHLGLRPSRHSMEVEIGSNTFPFSHKGFQNIPRKKEISGFLKARSSGLSLSSRSSHNYGSTFFEHVYPSDGFPIQFQDFFLISAGNIDSRPSYHNGSEIWPVGYLSSWHDKITGSIFVCEVADGGDPGPIFKVRRYPCTLQSIPTASTVLLTPKLGSHVGEENVENGSLATFGLVDEESLSIQAMLADCSPPDLNNDTRTAENQDEDFALQRLQCSMPDNFGNVNSCVIGQGDSLGEFLVEGRSASSVWEMVCQTLLHACSDAHKQKGLIQFCCTHDVCKMDDKELSGVGSLSKFCYVAGSFNFPRLVQSDFEFRSTCEMLMKWLEQDRFGLDADFVQEIIEQLPGISACSNYRSVMKRKHNTTPQTVKSGFLRAKRKNHMQDDRDYIESLRISKRLRKQPEVSDIRGPCPSGKPFSMKLPAYLIGDVLQVWEFSLRFSEVVGMEDSFSFEELVEELVSPWIDGTSSMEMPGFDIQDARELTLVRGEMESLSGRMGSNQYSRCTGLLLAKTHGVLLKALVTELLSKVAVYVDPYFGAGGSKSRRGRKKDADNLATLKKTKLDMLPINEVTWPEVARRYILALLSMEVNLESAEIACRESGKVFHCLQGDGGTLCGSLTGVDALEADAMLLAEATKEIFGQLKSGNIFVAVDQKEPDATGARVDDGKVPEWAKALEPVRKLPTNVGARIRKCIHEAMEKDPPEWARKILEHSISKGVYKGNASGPTKRAVISVLDDVNRENISHKPEKEEKVKNACSVTDLIMKQCRIILRRAVKKDKDKVFCNLLGRAVLKPNDNDDEGLLGHPAMVSRPLDFRTIDLKLAAGSYGGSHESFIDDAREVWHNIRTVYRDNSDLLELAGSLLTKFEEDYENEVLSLVQKTECSNDSGLSSQAAKERDELLVRVNESALPKAPWEEGICKICGMDKDDDNVLLCDGCDSEYHTYCLDPPLVKVPDGEWYCPPCESEEAQSRNASSGSRIIRQCIKRRLHRKLTQKFMDALNQLTRLMELKEYWELTLEDRIFLLKFLSDEVLNSAILRDHIDQSTSLSIELQQKLRSLGVELKLLKCREEILTASLAKLKSNVRSSGDMGSDALASPRSNDSKLKGHEPDGGSHNSSLSGGCKQLDDGAQRNGWNNHNKQSCAYTSKSVLDKTCVGNKLNNSPDSNVQCQLSLKDTIVSENTLSHAKCGTEEGSLQNELVMSTPKQENNEIPGVCLESALGSSNGLLPSATHFVPNHTLSGSIVEHTVERTPAAKYDRQCSIPADLNLAQAYHLEISDLKKEIRALEDSIAAKELELLKISVRKEFLGQDAEGRLYWTFGRSGSSRLVANSSVIAPKKSSCHLWPYGVENSRQSGLLDSSDLWENMGMPSYGLWTSYQSDAEIEKLLGWLSEDDMRERELKESILQWRSNKTKECNLSESDTHNKRRLNTCIPSEGEKHSNFSFNSDSLDTRAVIAIRKKFNASLAEEGTEICRDLNVKVRVSCEGGLYRCVCLEPLWPCRPHCLSCHQTFSTAEERVKHANDKCKTGSPVQEGGETSEQPSKRKRTVKHEMLHERSLSNISQASKIEKLGNDEVSRRDKHASALTSVENQPKPECPFKFEEIKGVFITRSSLKELVNDIGLIGCNGNVSFIPSASPYLSDPALGLVSQREDDVCAGKSADLESKVQESHGANSSGTHNRSISDNPNCIENGLVGDGPTFDRLKSTSKSKMDQFSSAKDKVLGFGVKKCFVIRESSLHPLVGRASEILRRLKINLLDMDAALPEEALRVSRSQSQRRRVWRAFVKSAATIYEMIQATIILEDTIRTEYLRNDWWYWSSPSAAARISTLSGLALRVYALDSAILYDKLSCEDGSEPCKEDKVPHSSIAINVESPSRPKQLDSEPADSSRAKSRTSKRRKDSSG